VAIRLGKKRAQPQRGGMVLSVFEYRRHTVFLIHSEKAGSWYGEVLDGQRTMDVTGVHKQRGKAEGQAKRLIDRLLEKSK